MPCSWPEDRVASIPVTPGPLIVKPARLIVTKSVVTTRQSLLPLAGR